MSSSEIDDERLFAYAAGELDAAQAAAVEATLAAEPAQAATVARYQLVQAVLRADDSVRPPDAVLERARAIFPQESAAVDPARLLGLFDAARRIVAELRFDSRAGQSPALAGFRGGSISRQLMFESEGTVIDLQLEPPIGQDLRWRILGQVDTGSAAQGLVVGLAPDNADFAAVAVTTDVHGGFHLQAVAGNYTILVRIPDAVVVLPNLVIG